MTGERAVRIWAWIAAAHEGGPPVSVAAVCRAAVRQLGMDGAGVTATGGPAAGSLAAREPLFASDELTARLEELQFTVGEGPAAADFRLGSPVLVPDLAAAEARWPGFAPAAVAAGARAMFVLPLQAGAIRVGMLSLYRARPGLLTAAELGDALLLADIALGMVLDASAGISGLPEYRPLDGLSDRRAGVYQAVGMVSVQLSVSLEEAFARLRAHAFASGRELSDIADAVVTRQLRLDPDPLPPG